MNEVDALRGEVERLRDEVRSLRDNPRDEHHTMEELYFFRMLYNALAVNAMPGRAVKSWRHHDGELCFGGGWFVVCLDLPTSQVSNHYEAKHWDSFHCPAVPTAPEWDGHTSEVAAQRLLDALEWGTRINRRISALESEVFSLEQALERAERSCCDGCQGCADRDPTCWGCREAAKQLAAVQARWDR